MCVGCRLEFQDEESKQLAPMVEADVGEERRPWQSPRRRAFLCPTALGTYSHTFSTVISFASNVTLKSSAYILFIQFDGLPFTWSVWENITDLMFLRKQHYHCTSCIIRWAYAHTHPHMLDEVLIFLSFHLFIFVFFKGSCCGGVESLAETESFSNAVHASVLHTLLRVQWPRRGGGPCYTARSVSAAGGQRILRETQQQHAVLWTAARGTVTVTATTAGVCRGRSDPFPSRFSGHTQRRDSTSLSHGSACSLVEAVKLHFLKARHYRQNHCTNHFWDLRLFWLQNLSSSDLWIEKHPKIHI